MESYTTLLEALDGLKAQGYTEDFNFKENCIGCRNGEFQLSPDDFKVDKFFRFEGDPDEQCFLNLVYQYDYEIDLSSNPGVVYLYRVIDETGKPLGEGEFVIEK